MSDLYDTAKALVADDKGILAADESSGTIAKRFDSISLESTEENRRAYRDMLFTTPELEQSVSGVILFDETIRQSSADGTAFLERHSWEEYAAWHLGLTVGANDETKARYAFVYGDFRRVHRSGLIDHGERVRKGGRTGGHEGRDAMRPRSRPRF